MAKTGRETFSLAAALVLRERGNATRRMAVSHLPTAGFTMIEVLAALLILALASSSVLLVIDRCLSSASDSSLRMAAFELVRENLEQICALDTVEEKVDFGTSEQYPAISWQSVVEGFPEPTTGQMWVRAVCSADYIDSKGEKQKVELVRWLCQLTDQQAGLLLNQQDLEKLTAEQTLATNEEAAEYAKIDADTLRQWVQDGLLRTPEGTYLRHNLDIFMQNKGNPTPEQKAEQVESIQDLAMKLKVEQMQLAPDASVPPDADGRTGTTGQTREELVETRKREVANPR